MVSKILMFGWEFPPHNSGGLGVACHGLTKALADKGAEIIFVLPKKVDINSKHLLKIVFADEISKIKFKPINSLLSPYITSEKYETVLLKEQQPSIYGEGLFEEVKRYALRAKSVAISENFDIIHAHDWLSFMAGNEAKKATGKPLVIHVHATEFDRTGGNGVNQHVYEIEKEGMEQCDAIIAVSQFTKGIITRHYGINPQKICVVHNAVEPKEEEYQLKTDPNAALLKLKEAGKKIILFVGRITLQKGPDYFLKTAKKILEFNPNVIFIMAGSGDMERQMIQEAASLGISDKVFFPGFLRGKELSQLYQIADLYILPSVSEPFGITPLESLVNNTPILISKQSGVSEIITHALKADFWDVEEMTDKTLAVLNHPPLYECLRENGFNEVKKINWQVPAQKCLDIYNQLSTASC